MTYSSSMEGTVVSVLNLNSNRSAATTFTSVIQSVKITSDHYGAPNHELHIEQASIRYVPQGTGTLRCSWEYDSAGTSGQTVQQNPFVYEIMSTGDPGTTFTLATDANDSTAADMVREDDIYVHAVDPQGQGKSFEFKVTVSDESNPVITGLEIEARLVKAAAYVGGTY